MLEHAVEKFISHGGKDTVTNKLMYQCQWLCVTQHQMWKFSAKLCREKALHS